MRKEKKYIRDINLRKIFILLICFIMLFTSNSFQVYGEKTEKKDDEKVVRVGWFDSSYNTIDASGRRIGYCYEYERKIAGYIGWKYEYVEGSWTELLEMLENGEIDMLGGVSYTEERAEKMLYSSYSIGIEEYHLYIPTDNLDDYNGNFSYFNGKKIGVNKNSIQVEMLKEWAELYNITPEIVEVTTSENESVEMLLNGELDGYITLDSYLSGDDIYPVVKIGSSDFYFAVNKQRPDLLAELDNALSKIRDENRFYDQELFVKYNQNLGANLYLSDEEIQWIENHGEIKVGYIDNYLAYCDKDDESGKLTGVLSDYLKKATTCFSNGELNFKTYPYENIEVALDALKSGEIDCVFPANFSVYDGEIRKVCLTPSLARATLYMVVKTSKNKDVFNKEEGSVAVVSGDINYESLVNEIRPGWKVRHYSNTNECIKAVKDNKVDCYFISSYRYNEIRRLCDKYKLNPLDTGKDIPFCFAVREDDSVLYSIIAKATNIIPDSYINNTLTSYFYEEGKITLIDLIKENIIIVIGICALIVAMLSLIIGQRRIIKAEKKAKENRRIADDLSRRVYVDALTSVRNKGGYNDYVGMLQDRLDSKEVTEFAICMFDCDNLKVINDKYGHERGDEYLKAAVRLICQVFRNSPVFRIGGDEFISILQNDDYKNREELVRKFEEESMVINEKIENEWEHVNTSVGMAVFDSKADRVIDDTVKRADELMYENKRKRKASGKVR